jgi:hypothetical protein
MRGQLKRAGQIAAVAVLLFMGWCALIAIYFAIYGEAETAALPPVLPTKSFSTEMWDQGYFEATGSLINSSALIPDDS